MKALLILQEVAPSAGTIGAIIAAVFLLLFLGAAYVAYKALRKTVSIAIRMAVVAAILLIAVVGSISLWYFSGSGTPKQKPPVERRR